MTTNERPTPLTDAAEAKWGVPNSNRMRGVIAHARQLERMCAELAHQLLLSDSALCGLYNHVVNADNKDRVFMSEARAIIKADCEALNNHREMLKGEGK